MHPSPFSNSNAPFQAAIASLVDCNILHDRQEEQADTTLTTQQHSPFAELKPRRASSTKSPSAIPKPRASLALHATIDEIKDYLRQLGLQCDDLKYKTIINRLDLTNLSAETLFNAIKTANDANSPLLANLAVNGYERSELINRLAETVARRYGFREGIRAAIDNSNNNPHQVIINLLDYLRNS